MTMTSMGELVGDSPAIVALREEVRRLLASLGTGRLPPVLIEGRDGDRQGAPGPAPSPGRPPCGRAVRRDQLRRDSRDAARVRDVRLRARRVHGRAPAEVGAPRGGAAGHVLPRRGRAPARGGPGEAPQGHRGPRGPPPRRDAEHRPRRLDHRRHQRGPRGGAPGGPVPGGALPPTVGPDLPAAGAADPRGRRRPALPSGSSPGRARSTASAPSGSAPTRAGCSSSIPGPATCASSRTSWSGSPCSARRRSSGPSGSGSRCPPAAGPAPRSRRARRRRRPAGRGGRRAAPRRPSIRRAGTSPWPRAVSGSPGTRSATGSRSTGCAPARPRRARPGRPPISRARGAGRDAEPASPPLVDALATRAGAAGPRGRRSRAGSRPCAGSSGG